MGVKRRGGYGGGGNGGGKSSWKSAEPYVTCGNPKCRPWGPHGPLSWRSISRGPGVCVHCGEDFPIQISGGNEGWSKKDAKGRTRPVGATAAADASAATAECSDQSVRAFLRVSWKGTDEELDAHIAKHFPKEPEPPPPPLQQYKEALAQLDKAQKSEKHLEGQLAQKQASFVKQCQALKDYAETVEQAKTKLEESRSDVIAAQHNLQQLRAQEASQVVQDPKELMSTYDPTASIFQKLSTLEVLKGIQCDQANAIGGVLVDIVREHLNQAVLHLVPGINAASATTGVTAASNTATAAVAFVDGIPGDVAMKSQYIGKRGFDEVELDDGLELSLGDGVSSTAAQPSEVTQDLCNQALLLANNTLNMAAQSLGDGQASAAARLAGNDGTPIPAAAGGGGQFG